MPAHLDLSILFPTYNRTAYLRQTLEAMARLDCEGLSAEWVVIDNNSTDNTRAVVESFAKQLPLRYLFEPCPGMNRAYNRALDEVALGKIVVFTDDDVIPQTNWLKAIVSSCERWPEASVFGGKVELIWPPGEIPDWARNNSYIQGIAFARCDLGDADCPYPAGEYPVGPNFWVRREVFAEGRRFDVSMGPRPGGYYRMGGETAFLVQLAAAGHRFIYTPEAVVGHQVRAALLSPAAIRTRFFCFGLGWPHLNGLSRADLLEKHPLVWYLLRLASIVRDTIRYLWAPLSWPRARRLERSVHASRWLACNIESLRIACRSKKK